MIIVGALVVEDVVNRLDIVAHHVAARVVPHELCVLGVRVNRHHHLLAARVHYVLDLMILNVLVLVHHGEVPVCIARLLFL